MRSSRTDQRLDALDLASQLARAAKGSVRQREAFMEQLRERLGLGSPSEAGRSDWDLDRLTREELHELCRLHTKACGYTSHAGGQRVDLTPEEWAKYDAPAPDSGVSYSRATPRMSSPLPAQARSIAP
jgi:hypothetical protein